MKLSTHHSGISAVELLVAIFIAVTFLLAGYQLYSFILNDSGQTRQHSKASNIARDFLRSKASEVPEVCSEQSEQQLPVDANSFDGLSNVRVYHSRQCPQSSPDKISRVQVRVVYGDENKEVTHVILASAK